MKDRQILALGFFDGIHLGHAALLRAACELAERGGATAAVVTFDRHPDTLISGVDVPLISDTEDRSILIRQVSGIERVLLLPFTRETMRTPWQTFLDTLTAQENAAGYVVGSDFHFGWRGEGSAEKLRDYCRERGLLCRVISPVRLKGLTVSSTLIRKLLLSGEMDEAILYLGHPHLLSGFVRGGVLTPRPGVLLPAPGLYSVLVSLPGGRGVDLRSVVKTDRVLLPRPELCGELRLDFTRRLTAEEEI